MFFLFFQQTRKGGSPEAQPKSSGKQSRPKRGEPGYVAPKRNVTPLVELAHQEKTLESIASKYKRSMEFEAEREDIKKRLKTYGTKNKKGAQIDQAVQIAESLLEFEDSWSEWDAYNYHDSKGVKYKDQDILSTLSELIHKVADSINPESQFNPNYWKNEHESAMEVYEEIKERADAHKQAKISLM